MTTFVAIAVAVLLAIAALAWALREPEDDVNDNIDDWFV